MKSIVFNNQHILISTAFLVAIDQSTKHIALAQNNTESYIIIPKLIKYSLVKNYGASFGMLSNLPYLLSLISLLVSFVLIILLIRNRSANISKKIAFMFLLAGTLGNGIDRWFLGYVIDFIQLIPINFPVFNLSDIYINIALLIIIYKSIFSNSNNTNIHSNKYK